MSPGIELIFVLVIFVGLLCVGMTIPFAITVPSVLYLLLHAGLPGAEGHRPRQLGQHEQLHPQRDSAVHPDGGDPAGSGLSMRVYQRTGQARVLDPGGLLQTNIAGCAIFAAISGSSVATAASIGRVALPELQEAQIQSARCPPARWRRAARSAS